RQQVPHALGARPLKQNLELISDLGIVQVRVGIKQFHRRPLTCTDRPRAIHRLTLQARSASGRSTLRVSADALWPLRAPLRPAPWPADRRPTPETTAESARRFAAVGGPPCAAQNRPKDHAVRYSPWGKRRSRRRPRVPGCSWRFGQLGAAGLRPPTAIPRSLALRPKASTAGRRPSRPATSGCGFAAAH